MRTSGGSVPVSQRAPALAPFAVLGEGVTAGDLEMVSQEEGVSGWSPAGQDSHSGLLFVD